MPEPFLVFAWIFNCRDSALFESYSSAECVKTALSAGSGLSVDRTRLFSKGGGAYAAYLFMDLPALA